MKTTLTKHFAFAFSLLTALQLFPLQAIDDPWVGITSDYSEAGNAHAHLQDLGIRRVRFGGNAWSGGGNLAAQDAQVDYFASRGYTIHFAINYRGNGIDLAGTNIGQLPSLDTSSSTFQTWYNRYKAACKEIMQRYQGKITHYICGNEPDLPEHFTGLPGRPDIAVLMTKAMFEAAREVDPNIIVQSAPTSRPDADYLRRMIVDYHVAEHCDVIGIHAYGSQFSDNGLKMPWQWLNQVGARKPVGISECGVPLDAGWNPQGLSDHEWRARWHSLAYVQAKAFGFSHMILFTHGGHCEWTEKWAYRDRNNGYAEKQPNYDQVKSIFQTRPFDNGGFEEANDPITEWVPIIPFDQAVPPNDTAFIRNDPDGARTGNGYLKFTMDGRLKRTVRRIITGLEPGATYEVGVYCAVRGGGVAQLDVRGFDPLDGDASVLHKIDNRFDGEWEPLKVRFVAGNSWAVLSLLADYPNEVRFDDVTVTLVDPGIPDEAGVEK